MAFIVGPLVGGALVDVSSWRWVFAINVVPIAATVAVLARIPPSRHPPRKATSTCRGRSCARSDWARMIYGLIEAPAHGWGAPSIYLPLVGGAAAFAAFLIYERSAPHPMLDFKAVSHPELRDGQHRHRRDLCGPHGVHLRAHRLPAAGLGYSATASGLALLPVTILMFLLSPVAGGWPASTVRAGS
jgi:MFS family permease